MNSQKLKKLRKELHNNGFDPKQALYTVGEKQTPTYVNPAAIKEECTIRLARGCGRQVYKAMKRKNVSAVR
jgi:hypothetical protein